MAQIEVKYDPTLQLEPIVDIMYSSSDDPDGQSTAIDQKQLTGIIAPLIRLNDITINFTQVRRMELKCTGLLPELTLSVEDSLGLTLQLDHPKMDNILRLQILPAFDNAYKKIDLRFYIVNFETRGSIIDITARYNVKELYRNRLEAYGEKTFYEMCDKIAKDSQLGLASNVNDTEDTRYMYCANHSYLALLDTEVRRSGTQTLIPDVWVDLHNYLNVVDMWERFTAADPMQKVWSIPYNRQWESNRDVEPVEIDAVITNAPAMMTSQLYCGNYKIANNSRDNVANGTDKIVEVYHYNKNESESRLIQDGDIHDDIFTKTIYAGEEFGDSSFRLQQICRSSVMQKINSQLIVVSLQSPMLGLERGTKVEFRWYDANDMTYQTKKENDITIDTEVPEGEQAESDMMVLNKQISGQYLIVGVNILYKGNMLWEYELLLGRPGDRIKKYGDDK